MSGQSVPESGLPRDLTRESIPFSPAEPEEDAPNPAPSDPLSPMPEGRRRRWLIGGGIALAAVAVAIWAAVFLTARPLPEGLRYLPGKSIAVAELRPDLPGDQRTHLGNLLAHFPGFADQSNLSEKIDELLTRITNAASHGTVDYATRVKPLLAGPIFLAIGDPAPAPSTQGAAVPRGLVVMTTDGTASCDVVFGSATELETYRAASLRSVGSDLVCAVDGKFLLLGDAAGVRAGLDARRDGSGMDTNARYRTAHGALEGDQLGSVYVDGTRAADLLKTAMAASGTTLTLSGLPEWAVVGLRVVDDAVTLDLRTAPVHVPAPSGDLPTAAPAAVSRLAPLLPTDTLGYLEIHGVGALVQHTLAALRDNPATSAAVGQVEQQLAIVGGLGNLVGWIDELGVAVVPGGADTGGVGGAVLIRGDATKVAAQLAQLHNLLVLASTGTDITLHDSPHAGTTITTVDLGDLGALASALGVPGLGGGGVRLVFSLAARDGLLMVTLGDGVAQKLLDVPAGSGLDTTPAYQGAIRLAGTPNDAQLYVALDGILGWAEAHLPSQVLAGAEQSLRPYLDHLAGLAASGRSTPAGAHERLVLTVK